MFSVVSVCQSIHRGGVTVQGPVIIILVICKTVGTFKITLSKHKRKSVTKNTPDFFHRFTKFNLGE